MKLNNTIQEDTAQFLYENWENGNRMYIVGYLSAKEPSTVAYLAISMMEIARANGVAHVFASDFRAVLVTRIKTVGGSAYA